MLFRRALISVSDKTGIVEFAEFLSGRGVEILSTGGTAKLLQQNKIPVIEVSEFTKSPEMLGGRVKTLHPKIHGGLLGIRDDEVHQREMRENGIEPIDLLVVNLYPFEQTIARKDCTFEMAIENIDIGGPAMLRAAAKNHRFVTIVVDPADYTSILGEMRLLDGGITSATNERLARKVFQLTARYDGLIADYLGRRDAAGNMQQFGETIHLALKREQVLRYGENPHQSAALYGTFSAVAEQLHGKELSYNNILDANCAILTMNDFLEEELPVVSIAKHTTPCGIAAGPTLREAFDLAFETDPDSPFGGIIIVNKTWDLELAERVNELFTEVLIAPDFTPEALEYLRKKKNRRLLRWDPKAMRLDLSYRGVVNGMLVQEYDTAMEIVRMGQVATTRPPTTEEYASLAFAWKVAKAARSNVVVFGIGTRTLAIGSGSPARVGAVHVASDTAKRLKISLKGSVLASEAFFPFRDGVDQVAAAGATAIVQPGGSTRDEEAIEAANEHDMAMIFTHYRHFRH
ncbi:MAG: bifunctional phosphoribosylaminoimidazolecarboxamide formyltransferase/IMP cyclohydrolase [Patescibacteria group bacterium]